MISPRSSPHRDAHARVAHGNQRRSAIALGVAVFAGIAGILWLRDPSPASAPVATSNDESTTERSTVLALNEQVPAAVGDRESKVAPHGASLSVAALPTLPPPAQDLIAGPRNENLVPGAKPHPVTSEHLALYREVNLVESTWTALEQRDFIKARELIEERRLAYAGRNDDLDRGMSLLADCMQYPSSATRELAKRFYDDETYSTARRRIRRWCLEP